MNIKKTIGTFLLKTKILEFVHRLMINRLVSVQLSQIRCQQMPFSEKLGFSGKTIDHFPCCQFFKMFITDEEKAYREFFEWMYSCFKDLKAYAVPQEDGGWANGSLVRELRHIHKENQVAFSNLGNAKEDLVQQAIDKRVSYYFALFHSIRVKGYNLYVYPPIRCYQQNGFFYLKSGHHRISALKVLGVKHVSVVLDRHI